MNEKELELKSEEYASVLNSARQLLDDFNGAFLSSQRKVYDSLKSDSNVADLMLLDDCKFDPDGIDLKFVRKVWEFNDWNRVHFVKDIIIRMYPLKWIASMKERLTDTLQKMRNAYSNNGEGKDTSRTMYNVLTMIHDTEAKEHPDDILGYDEEKDFREIYDNLDRRWDFCTDFIYYCFFNENDEANEDLVNELVKDGESNGLLTLFSMKKLESMENS